MSLTLALTLTSNIGVRARSGSCLAELACCAASVSGTAHWQQREKASDLVRRACLQRGMQAAASSAEVSNRQTRHAGDVR